MEFPSDFSCRVMFYMFIYMCNFFFLKTAFIAGLNHLSKRGGSICHQLTLALHKLESLICVPLVSPIKMRDATWGCADAEARTLGIQARAAFSPHGGSPRVTEKLEEDSTHILRVHAMFWWRNFAQVNANELLRGANSNLFTVK